VHVYSQFFTYDIRASASGIQLSTSIPVILKMQGTSVTKNN
jgi:hypothetical protein